MREPLQNLVLSNAVRPGVVGWLKTLAREVGPDGITVNTIAPGRIDTERLREVYGPGGAREEGDLEQIPARRFGTPEEIAAVVTFLASDRARIRDRCGDPGGRRAQPLPPLTMSPRWLALTGAALLVGVVLGAATLRSDDYLYIPNGAHPVASKVEVEGTTDPSDGGGIFYVDVTVKRASWLERLVPFIRPDGASLVPAHAVTAPGESFKDRIAEARTEMNRSERVAAAVALKAAGLAVQAKPRGVLIEAVATDVPAARTLESGDVIVEAAGRSILTTDALRSAVGSFDPGDEVSLRLRRDGELLERTVRTIADPADRDRAIIGIRVSQDARISLPIKVDIDLGDVGGPSAGLPFALEVYQELGNDVDRGYDIAATGEIELDGTVASVGGIKQKTFGVRSSGAEVFLVPAGENAATARRYAGSLRVIPVESFEQALHILETLPEK